MRKSVGQPRRKEYSTLLDSTFHINPRESALQLLAAIQANVSTRDAIGSDCTLETYTHRNESAVCPNCHPQRQGELPERHGSSSPRWATRFRKYLAVRQVGQSRQPRRKLGPQSIADSWTTHRIWSPCHLENDDLRAG